MFDGNVSGDCKKQEKYIPVMSDFYEQLLIQSDAEEKKIAKDIALSLEIFVKGSLNIFNHQTNVDMDNRFTVYGIRDLGQDLGTDINAYYDGGNTAENC